MGWKCPCNSVISKVIFSFSAASFNKTSSPCFCDSNPMISTITATSSSTNHNHRSITTTQVTPEAYLVAILDVATTLSLLKPVCCLVLTAILNRAASQAPVTGPNLAVSEVAITCDFWSKCLSTQTVPWVCNRGVWLESSLHVILNSPPLTCQNDDEIMSALTDGLLVVPAAFRWSYHQSPLSFIQFLPSLLEKRAINNQPDWQ